MVVAIFFSDGILYVEEEPMLPMMCCTFMYLVAIAITCLRRDDDKELKASKTNKERIVGRERDEGAMGHTGRFQEKKRWRCKRDAPMAVLCSPFTFYDILYAIIIMKVRSIESSPLLRVHLYHMLLSL
ncbi:hypothetical protein AAC387_Pa07g2492 [Persea americana]